MFGFFKSPANKNSVDSSNGLDNQQNNRTGRRTASEPALNIPDFDDDDGGRRNKHKNGFLDSDDLDSMSVQELENYTVNRAQETTKTVNNCLKIAEDIRQDATRTLETLHQQGEQIERTHRMAADMDKDLSKGEKLLGNLGGMFSKPWKPKKAKDISGPVITQGLHTHDNARAKQSKKEQREKLGLAPAPRGRSAPTTPPSEPTNALQKVETEKAKQDDSLSDLSDILGDLKGMAVEMGSELNRQNKALDHLHDDVEELNSRVKGANQRARHLLAK